MIDLIHIGDYKTGTSWFQNKFFSSHPDLCYIDSGEHEEIVYLMHQLVDARDLDFDAESLQRKFVDVIRGANVENKKVIISREALSAAYPTGDNAKRIAERLHAVFGKTKVLIVIREQFSMLKSIYSQYVKIGGTLSFKNFVYDPIVSPGLLEKLKYHKIIDEYVNIFGKENVFVGLFEDFKLDNELFARRIFQFIGCSDQAFFFPKELGKVNPSLTVLGLEVQRFMNHFLRNEFNPRAPFIPFDRFVALFLSSERKTRLLNSTRNRLIYSVKGRDDAWVLRYAINFAITVYLSRFCERIQFGSKLKVPDQIVKDLKQEFVLSNKVLRDEYELPVCEYGWII